MYIILNSKVYYYLEDLKDMIKGKLKVNLVIDGTYVMSKNTFSLHKAKKLYGEIYKSMESSMNNYRKMYPFDNVYLVSDSKGETWRKKLYSEYKANRVKKKDIDWEFVNKEFKRLKDYYKNNTSVQVLEKSSIEGDDWISHLVSEGNSRNESFLIISNDHDMFQLIKKSFEPMFINFVSNEMVVDYTVFFPYGYQEYKRQLVKNANAKGIFSCDNEFEVNNFIGRFETNATVLEKDSFRELLFKIVIGDVSDNIKSAYVKKSSKLNKKGEYSYSGIGKASGSKIVDKFLDENPNFYEINDEVYEKLADIILEVKKIDVSEFNVVLNNLKFNNKLMSLDGKYIPKEIVQIMNEEISNYVKGTDVILTEEETILKDMNSEFKFVEESSKSENDENDDFFNDLL